MEDRTCLILAGGDPAALPDRLPDSIDLVIAADSGIHLTSQIGLVADVLIGDLDSANREAVDRARRAGTIVEHHAADKDATDLELALDAALARGVATVIVVGGTSLERIDHLLANAAVIAAPRFADLAIEWWLGSSRVIAARGDLVLEGTPGDVVSIIPVGGDVEVSTDGLRWPLDRERLGQGTTRGVSNEMLAATATVVVGAGTALVVHTRRHP